MVIFIWSPPPLGRGGTYRFTVSRHPNVSSVHSSMPDPYLSNCLLEFRNIGQDDGLWPGHDAQHIIFFIWSGTPDRQKCLFLRKVPMLKDTQ